MDYLTVKSLIDDAAKSFADGLTNLDSRIDSSGDPNVSDELMNLCHAIDEAAKGIEDGLTAGVEHLGRIAVALEALAELGREKRAREQLSRARGAR